VPTQPRPYSGRNDNTLTVDRRDYELSVVQILCRRTKNNPVLIGEPGAGKTAIVEGLAQRISEGDVLFLADKRIWLDLSPDRGRHPHRGQFEERLKTIAKELMENQNAIIFIDESPRRWAGSARTRPPS
jgi:ATP-dependent Clp protease ATP-binding subunit ClpC